MTHHHLNQPEKAQHWLDKAVQILDLITIDQPPPGATAITAWSERLELRLLRAEATELIQGNKSVERQKTISDSSKGGQ
jgi:hypothetical protein